MLRRNRNIRPLQRGIIAPALTLGRDPLEGVVEVDQTEMAFRADDDPNTPLKTGKIIIPGAVEVIDRATGKAQRPKALGQKYLDTLSGRIRLAAITSNHATHIHNLHQGQHRAGRDVGH